MVEWTSPEEIASNAVVFTKFVHTLLGLYIWEWVTTLDFDLTFVTGKRRFRWPMIFYFYGRYAMLAGLIGFVIILDAQQEINCKVAYLLLQVLGNTALGVASINLSLRTVVIWSKDRTIITLISILILGHFAIIIRSMFGAHSTWIPGQGCVTTSIQSTVFAAMYIYTMMFDFLIMCLTGYKLWFVHRERRAQRSRMVRMLFQDGLIYFFVAFLGNMVAVVFSLLGLNPIMSLIADIPATTFATIAAGRVVRRLSNYLQPAAELYNDGSCINRASANTNQSKGVRVEMSTFTDAANENRYGRAGHDHKASGVDAERGDSEDSSEPPVP